MLLSRKSFVAARFAAALIAGSALVAGVFVAAPAAYAGTNDYPSKWKNVARDSMFDNWGEYNRECTSWVAWRLHGHNKFEMPFHANAGNWGADAKRLGYTVNLTPAVGSVAYWDTSTRSHVAWVEAVNPNKTVTIEEYNIGGSGKYDEATIGTSTPTGYIHFQDLATSFADGAYVTYKSNVYRMAGGAPMYVSSWAKFGKKPSGLATAKQWAALKALPADGTFLVAQPSAKIYRIVGGAPVYIKSWDVVGGKKASVSVFDADITNAGAAGTSLGSHLRKFPADKEYVVTSPSSKIYQINGGAADPVADWASVGGQQPAVQIGDEDIANAGSAATGPYSHLLGAFPTQVISITGTTKVGHTLVAHLGKWTGDHVVINWLRDGVAMANQHAQTLLLWPHTAHRKISVQITVTRANYRTLTEVSTVTPLIRK
ncbi:MAG: hypothetical protein JWQ39_1822 [Glaciihabitans sp.]|nr:hypothetical protein [Glaciihabitans sp.]